jgi:hypothetical protein
VELRDNAPAAARTQALAGCLKSSGFPVIAAHVPKETAEFLEGAAVERSLLFQTFLGSHAKLVKGLGRLGHTDYRNIEMATHDQRLKRRE